jgi:hypothetical protein
MAKDRKSEMKPNVKDEVVDNASILAESRHKLGRGKEHLETLNGEIATFLDSKSYSTVREFDPKQSKHLIKFAINTPIPQVRWGMIIGDCVHNARTSLDYIAFRLAGSDVTNRKVMFPIYLEPKPFRDSLWRLKGIHRDAIRAIEEFQPYTRPDPRASALWALNELDARDKHKLLTMTEPTGRIVHLSESSPFPIFIPMGPNRRIEHNTTIAEILAHPDQKVTVEAELTLDILFERGIISAADDYEVSGTLEIIFETVNLIITSFENLIAANPDWIKAKAQP